jgi:hypothetical protein
LGISDNNPLMMTNFTVPFLQGLKETGTGIAPVALDHENSLRSRD